MATEEARNLIVKDSLITNANLLALTNASETALHSHAGGGGGGFISRCSVYQNGNQTIAIGTSTLLEFDTELFDGDGEWDTTNYKFVAGATGYYQVNAILYIAPISAGKIAQLQIHVNDVLVVRLLSYAYGANPQCLPASKLLYLEANDEVKFRVEQNSGGNVLVFAGHPYTFATIHRVS